MRYPEFEVRGTPREMGRQVGEATRELIRGFVEIAVERVNRTVRISREAALEAAAAAVVEVERHAPDLLEEVRGMADGAAVSTEEVMLLQVRNQLQPTDESGCTSLGAAAAAADVGHVIGQNWDNDPALDPFTIVLTRRPEGRPAVLNITQAGLVGYIGCNDEGVGLCLNSLPAPSRRHGVPHYFIVRRILEAVDLAGAVNAIESVPRVIPANLLLVTRDGPVDLEVTIDQVRVLQPESGVLTHTNHCLHPDLAPINRDFPELIDSGPRKRRIDEMLAGLARPITVDALRAALADHQNHPRSICRHENDDPLHGFWATVFSVIIEAEAGRMNVTRGNPCECEYELYELR